MDAYEGLPLRLSCGYILAQRLNVHYMFSFVAGIEMFGAVTKIFLTLSALTPICLVYAWVAITEDYAWLAFWLLLVTPILAVSSYAILRLAQTKLQVMDVKFLSAESADQENIALLLLYISPLFVDTIKNVNLNILVPSLAIYATLLAVSYTFHFNPWLSLMGWHFYKVQTAEGIGYVYVTRTKLVSLDKPFSVSQLTGYMLIEHTG